jgi:hypothetical protein
MARKLIGFDPETLQALELLSNDSGRSLQQLAAEAFTDLLVKHHRPCTFVEALKQVRGLYRRTRTAEEAARVVMARRRCVGLKTSLSLPTLWSRAVSGR